MDHRKIKQRFKAKLRRWLDKNGVNAGVFIPVEE